MRGAGDGKGGKKEEAEGEQVKETKRGRENKKVAGPATSLYLRESYAFSLLQTGLV